MKQSPDTRASLLIRMRQHDDADAWSQFLEIYEPVIFRMALSGGLQHADAHEVVQEVLSRVAKAVETWQDSGRVGSFRGWLSRVTRNLVIQYFRDRKRRPLTADQSDVRRMVEGKAIQDGDGGFDRELQQQLFRWAAAKSQNKFEERTWQAFWRTAVDNEPIEEVARQLDMTRGAIYIARSRVMAQISQSISRKMTDLEMGGALTGEMQAKAKG